MKTKNIVLWILQFLLALALAGAAFGKLSGQPPMISLFDQIGLGQWFRYATGLIEMSAAVLLLVPRLRAFGAALALGTMLGALATHALIGGSAIPAAVLFSLAVIVLWGRKGELPGCGDRTTA